MEDIRAITQERLTDYLHAVGEKPFRHKQIWNWLWHKGAGSFDEMTDIPSGLRERLKESFTFNRGKIVAEAVSADKTAKFILQFAGGGRVECVLIPVPGRITACISSQVGCPLGCTFCATGKMGFVRNLHYSEIVDEYLLLGKKAAELYGGTHYGSEISNIVMMGMGEPLLNFDNVVKALDILTGPDLFGLSPKRITLSTAGIVKGIKALADREFSCGLAVSLHSADPEIRGHLMPVTVHNPLHDLQAALLYYNRKTGARVTLEYLLLANVNDSRRDAGRLARFCRPFPVKINIIEYNETEGGLFRRADPGRREMFIQYLQDCNMVVNVRQSRGCDIDAACGQLLLQKTGK